MHHYFPDMDLGSWPVCERYVIRNISKDVAQEKADEAPTSYHAVPGYPASEKGRWKWYFPLREAPDLFIEFARLLHEQRSPQTALAWYRKYGSLGIDSTVRVESDQLPGESIKTFFQEVEQAAAILSLCELVANKDEEAAEKLIREEFGYTTKKDVRFYLDADREQRDYLELARVHALFRIRDKFSPSSLLYLRVSLGSKGPPWVLARQHFRNLLEAMYVQVYEAMAEGGGIVPCKYCSQSTFLAPPLPGSKNGHWGKKFCSNQCRQRHHYYTKTKPKRQKAQQGKS